MQRQFEHWLFRYPRMSENKKKENGHGDSQCPLSTRYHEFSRDEYWRAARVTSANETSSTRVI